MSIPSEHPVDMVAEAEARVAFLSAAMVAFASVDGGPLPREKAWLGLFYCTVEVERLLGETLTALQQP